MQRPVILIKNTKCAQHIYSISQPVASAHARRVYISVQRNLSLEEWPRRPVFGEHSISWVVFVDPSFTALEVRAVW